MVLSKNMERDLEAYGQDELITEAWNILQHDLECCGINSYKDWLNTTSLGLTGTVPDECCIEPHENCGVAKALNNPDLAKKFIYINGCLVKLEAVVSSNINIVGGIGAFICVTLFLGILVSCHVAKGIRGQTECA